VPEGDPPRILFIGRMLYWKNALLEECFILEDTVTLKVDLYYLLYTENIIVEPMMINKEHLKNIIICIVISRLYIYIYIYIYIYAVCKIYNNTYTKHFIHNTFLVLVTPLIFMYCADWFIQILYC